MPNRFNKAISRMLKFAFGEGWKTDPIPTPSPILEEFYVHVEGTRSFAPGDVLTYPTVAMAWQQRQSVLISGYELALGDADSPLYDLFENRIDDYYHLLLLLQYYAFYGHALVIYDWVEDADGVIYPTNFRPVYNFEVAEEGFIVTLDGKRVTIPGDAVTYTYIKNTPSPYNSNGADLYTILKPLVEEARIIQKYWERHLKSFTTPTLLIAYNPAVSTEKVRQFTQMIHETVVRTAITYPENAFSITPLTPGSANPEHFRAHLEFLEHQMIKVILGQTLTSEAQTSSYALGKVHKSILDAIVARDAKLIEDALNKYLITQFYELNNIPEDQRIWLNIRPMPPALGVDEILTLAQMFLLTPKDVEHLLGRPLRAPSSE